MAEELQSTKNNNSCLRFFLGDVRDKDRLDMALKDINYVVHAAALKQVLQQSTILWNLLKQI